MPESREPPAWTSSSRATYACRHVAGTVSLVRDADRVVDGRPGHGGRPGGRSSRPLRELGVRPEDVTDIVLSHHHLDHNLNVALFPVVPVHDFQSVIEGDVFTSRPADGVAASHPASGCWPRPGTPRRTSPPSSAPPTTWPR